MRLSVRRLTTTGAFQGALMTGAMVIAGGFDALVNVASGRLLSKEQFGVFVAVTALLQVLVHLTNVIRNVAAFYAAEFTAAPEPLLPISAFFRRGWRWAWRWGLLAMLLMLVLSPLIARFMRIDTAWPLWAASLAVLMLFVRPVTDGTLQGVQHFVGLSAVQVSQSVLRLIFAIVLISAGLAAVGAILALPLATSAALLVALYFLRPYFAQPDKGIDLPAVSLRYSLYTLVGLLAFALLVNVDAIAVKRYFSEAVAGDYGTVVTLGKVNLFATLGIALVLFPKSTQRHAAGRDPRPVLLVALGAAFAVGIVLTTLFFLASGVIVQSIFSTTYTDPGVVLGLVGVATTLFAGVNVWLNYALSLERHAFVVALAVIVLLFIVTLALWHPSLVAVGLTMIAAGVAGNVAGAVVTLRRIPAKAAD